MKSCLLYPDKSIAGEPAYPSFQDIYKDLNLNIILKTMSRDDAFMMEQIRSVMMVPIRDSKILDYRYGIIKDFYDHDELIYGLYKTGRECMNLAEQYRKEIEQNRNKTAARTSSLILSLRFVQNAIQAIKKMKDCFDRDKKESGQALYSEGLCQLYDRLSKYPLDELEEIHKKALFYSTGGEAIFSVQISGGLKIEQSRLLKCFHYRANNAKGTALKIKKLYYKMVKKDSLLVEDDALIKDMRLFVELNMQKVLEFYTPWINDCISFMYDFAKEITFYMGVYNFQKRMKELDLMLGFGEVSEQRTYKKIDDLYELSLALYVQSCPITNNLLNEDTVLTIITGANQGGKSTFLRSFGIAQILMQCGMPVPAKHFSSCLYSKIHTHFTRKEDAMLSRGRLEEELKRMSRIISELSLDSLVLLNESFASTTEKEGSQIAKNVIIPLYERGVEVMMVTHLHEFARDMYSNHLKGTMFLVAERKENGARTFKILPGKPHYSSYGTDLYQYVLEN